MQFNSDSDNQDIVSGITTMTGQDTNSFTLKQRAWFVNMVFDMIWQVIFEAYGGWKFMDDNVSDATTGVPYATQDITSGTGLYVLPTGALVVNGVEILLTSGGTFDPLTPLSEEEFLKMGGDGGFPSTGTPLYYMLQGDVIRLLPTPNFTLASALRTLFDQSISRFASTDTTKVPGFASPFHPALAVGASWQFCLTKPNLAAKAAGLERMWNNYIAQIKSHYSKRFKAKKQGLFPTEDFAEEFR